MPFQSKQELFDTVAVHLIKQGEPAMDESDKCAYRGTGGRLCAAGVCIPDELYEKAMEGEKITYVMHKYIKVGEHLGGPSTGPLLLELQAVHDTYRPDEWPRKLREVSVMFHLSCAALEAAIAEKQGEITQ